MLAGVAAAFAGLTGLAVGFVRLAFLVLTLFGGFGILLYAVAWALLPSNDETQSPVERWLENLGTPGTRTAAILIGIAVLILLAPFAPFAVVAAAALALIGIYLTRRSTSPKE